MTRIDDDSVAVTYKTEWLSMFLIWEDLTAPIETLDLHRQSELMTNKRRSGPIAFVYFLWTVKYPAKIYIWKSGTVIKLLEKDFNGALLNSVKRNGLSVHSLTTGSEAENVVIGDQNSKCLLCLDKKVRFHLCRKSIIKDCTIFAELPRSGSCICRCQPRINRFSFKEPVQNVYNYSGVQRGRISHARCAIDKTELFWLCLMLIEILMVSVFSDWQLQQGVTENYTKVEKHWTLSMQIKVYSSWEGCLFVPYLHCINWFMEWITSRRCAQQAKEQWNVDFPFESNCKLH